MSQERDTHFQGFAGLAAQRLKNRGLLNIGNHIKPLVDPPIDFDYEEIKQILAECAYDLVSHVLGNEEFQWYELEEVSVEDIPDMTEWPKDV